MGCVFSSGVGGAGGGGVCGRVVVAPRGSLRIVLLLPQDADPREGVEMTWGDDKSSTQMIMSQHDDDDGCISHLNNPYIRTLVLYSY